jgi:hypothetical protein
MLNTQNYAEYKEKVIYQWAIRKEMRFAKNEFETFSNIPLIYYFFIDFRVRFYIYLASIFLLHNTFFV